jgi:N-acetylglucosamine-6-sulfatase
MSPGVPVPVSDHPKRWVCVGAAFAGAVIATASHSAPTTPQKASLRPNVVVILTDDQDRRSLRVMGDTRRLLARRGVTFANAFATYPVCCPSRATFLTGRYAHNHGVMSNDTPRGGYPAFRRKVAPRRTLPVRMRRAGYRTAYVGEFLNDYGHANPRQVPPGWSEWAALTAGTDKRMYGYTLNVNGQLRRYGSAPRDYQTDVLARRAEQFVRRAAASRQPFFLTLATLAPHAEFDELFGPRPHRNPRPAPRHLDRFDARGLPRPPSFNERDVTDKPGFMRRPRLSRTEIGALRRQHRSRLESLLAVDDAVERLVRTLRRTHELRRTLIVFTSDNGYLLGQHRLHGKELAFEESAGVPLLVRGPGLPAGRRSYQLAGNIDLAPTVLDAAQKNPHRYTDGVSLRVLARNPEASNGRALVLERDRPQGRPYQGVRTRRWVIVRHGGGGALELYDLARDPFELRNRARDPRYADERRQLMRRLRALGDCVGPSCR